MPSRSLFVALLVFALVGAANAHAGQSARLARLAPQLRPVPEPTSLPTVVPSAGPVRILTPRAGLVFSRSATVRVRVPRGSRSFRANVDGVRVTGFRRVDDVTYRGSVELRPGVRQLAVSVLDRRGRRQRASARLLVGRRVSGAVSIARVRRPAGSVGARVRLRFEPLARFRAVLNGRNVTAAFDPQHGRLRTVALGADDGLRFGRNELRVRGVARDGRYDVAALRFTVSRARPIAGAPDVRGLTRRRVQLDPSQSLPTRTGRELSYRWRLLRAPRGSRVGLRSTAGGTALLTPDRAGTYRLRLTAVEPHRPAASDTVTLRATNSMMPMGIPVAMQTFAGSGFEDQIGSDTVSYGSSNNVIAGIYDRVTFEQLTTLGYPGSASDATTMGSQIASYQSSSSNGVLVFMSIRPGTGTVDPSFNQVITSIGGQAISPPSGIAQYGMSIVGIPGTPAGSAWQHSAGGAMSGYVQLDQWGHYAFLAPSYLKFNTSVSQTNQGGVLQNTMQISGRRGFPPAPLIDFDWTSDQLTAPAGCPNAGGFQVVVIDTYYLLIGNATNQTFFTNQCNASEDFAAMQEMDQLLQPVINPPPGPTGQLVFIQGFGNNTQDVSTPSNAQAWETLGADVAALGGSEALFNETNGPYAFVGSNRQPTEGSGIDASSLRSSVPAVLTGTLARNRQFHHLPALADSLGLTGANLERTVYQAPTPWPYSSTAGEQSALTYLTQQLIDQYDAPFDGSACFPNSSSSPDLRAEYCDTTVTSNWPTYRSNVLALGATYPSGHGFSSADWTNVTTEVAQEMEWVPRVYGLATQLALPFATTQGPNAADVGQITQNVENSVNPPQGASVTGFWTGLVADVLSGISYFDAVSLPAGLFASALYLGNDLLDGPSGAPTFGAVQSTASELQSQVASQYLDAVTEFGHFADIIATDYGKLAAVGSSPNFVIDSNALALGAQGLRLGTGQWAYQALFSVAYPTLYYFPPNDFNPPGTLATNYACQNSYNYKPFGEEPATGQLLVNSSRYSYPLVIAPATNQSSWNGRGKPYVPTASLMNAAFAAPTYDSSGNPLTFGLRPEDFFSSNYPYLNPVDVGFWCD